VSWVAAVVTAVLSGLYTCAWGAFKDGPYEGFRARTFPRSILFSLALLGILHLFPSLRPGLQHLTKFQLFFLLMGLERGWTEVYKGCFRPPRDTERFLIPQQMTFFGKLVHSVFARTTVGVLLTAALIGGTLVQTEIRSFWWFLVTAFGAGVGVSLGGAYKDAPFEGFHPLKFFRSALVLAAVSPLFYFVGPTPLGFLFFMYGGLERMLVEYYKSFLLHSVPGKFRPELPVIQGAFLRYRGALNNLATVIAVGLAALYVFEWRG
jgi:hypothetical protein